MRPSWNSEPVRPRGVRRPMSEPRDIDASLYVFALCRQLQMTVLDRRGIDCMVDVEGTGRLPTAACRFLGRVVTELVTGASGGEVLGTTPPAVVVSLRRRGATCLCTVGCRGLQSRYPDRLHRVAADLQGRCMVRAMPERDLVAVMFDIAAIGSTVSDELWRRRAELVAQVQPARRSLH